jgi:hypothetical protein
MSNLEHELMAAERALRNIAEMTGGGYVALHWYSEIGKFGVNIHDGEMVRQAMDDRLYPAMHKASDKTPFDVAAYRAAKETAEVDEAA